MKYFVNGEHHRSQVGDTKLPMEFLAHLELVMMCLMLLMSYH